MKQKIIAAAVVALFAGAAYADPGVTLWGSLDVGIESSNSPNGGVGGAGSAHNTSMIEGAMSPSEFGIKVSEDLGGGLKAGAALTGGINITNGTIDNPGGCAGGGKGPVGIFCREANVSLSGDWGTLKAGLQYDPAVLASIATEPRGFTDGASNASYWIMGTLLNGPNAATFPGGIFDSNSVSYTYDANGLYLGVLVELGGNAGNSSANSGDSFGIKYSNSGFTVSGSYATYKNVDSTGTGSSTSSTIDGAGVAWTNGEFAVRAQYDEFKYNYVNGAAVTDVKSTGIGGDWNVGPNTVNLALYSAKDAGPTAGGKTTEIAIADYYRLSKSTKLWAQYITANAGTNSGDSAQISGVLGPGVAYSNGFAAGSTGGRTNIIGVGLIKSF